VNYLLVFVGAGLGGSLRHAVNVYAPRVWGTAFPYGTMAINIAGSLAMGLVAGWFAFRGDAPQSARIFLTTGILGGFTTFSAFSLDFAMLFERGEISNAAIYAGVSVAGALAALFAGLWIARAAF
jgi:CrcB protein